MRPLAACGRHFLQVFATGCLLAYGSRLLFELLGTSWLLQAGVNLAGVGGMFGVAAFLEKRRACRAASDAKAAGGLEGPAMGCWTVLNFNTGA